MPRGKRVRKNTSRNLHCLRNKSKQYWIDILFPKKAYIANLKPSRNEHTAFDRMPIRWMAVTGGQQTCSPSKREEMGCGTAAAHHERDSRPRPRCARASRRRGRGAAPGAGARGAAPRRRRRRQRRKASPPRGTAWYPTAKAGGSKRRRSSGGGCAEGESGGHWFC